MGRWGDGEMGRWGNGEMGRWGDGEMGRNGRWGVSGAKGERTPTCRCFLYQRLHQDNLSKDTNLI
ncbi:MAG: hypothetical protein F6K55_28525 [Moorea sp. SIO4A3]|nr:hypothetical protein [Moorena sp. SIO4A3]